MKTLKSLNINPPIVNSSNPWASDLQMLEALYECPNIGAVTTRSSMINGYPDDPKINQYVLFDPSNQDCAKVSQADNVKKEQSASLNTIVFSPYTLDEYLGFIKTISDKQNGLNKTSKPFIVSITGSADEVALGYAKINDLQDNVVMPLIAEVNLSCPNVPDKKLPAYNSDDLLDYLLCLKDEILRQKKSKIYKEIPLGIKIPPFTYQEQYENIFKALLNSIRQGDQEFCPITFISSTNTLGSSLVLKGDKYSEPMLKSLSGDGIGGLAGSPIHALSLGNVYTIRKMLDEQEQLKHIEIIGIGGVDSYDSFLRMCNVGANYVGVGTAIGVKGLKVFEEINSHRI